MFTPLILLSVSTILAHQLTVCWASGRKSTIVFDFKDGAFGTGVYGERKNSKKPMYFLAKEALDDQGYGLSRGKK